VPRVTDVDVRKMLTAPAAADLTEDIAAASGLVDDFCTASGYDDDKLRRIELWLSAHFVAVRYPRTTASSAGGVVSQQVQVPRLDFFLDNTSYGQQAIALDTKGNLARYNEQLKKGRVGLPSTSWVGCPRPKAWR
jgi:hypothetical protein